ncbi:hypothetical protein QQ045_011033 [Rhodiola kirilowii]
MTIGKCVDMAAIKPQSRETDADWKQGAEQKAMTRLMTTRMKMRMKKHMMIPLERRIKIQAT